MGRYGGGSGGGSILSRKHSRREFLLLGASVGAGALAVAALGASSPNNPNSTVLHGTLTSPKIPYASGVHTFADSQIQYDSVAPAIKPTSDDAVDLGTSALRFRDVFIGNAVKAKLVSTGRIIGFGNAPGVTPTNRMIVGDIDGIGTGPAVFYTGTLDRFEVRDNTGNPGSIALSAIYDFAGHLFLDADTNRVGINTLNLSLFASTRIINSNSAQFDFFRLMNRTTDGDGQSIGELFFRTDLSPRRIRVDLDGGTTYKNLAYTDDAISQFTGSITASQHGSLGSPSDHTTLLDLAGTRLMTGALKATPTDSVDLGTTVLRWGDLFLSGDVKNASGNKIYIKRSPASGDNQIILASDNNPSLTLRSNSTEAILRLSDVSGTTGFKWEVNVMTQFSPAGMTGAVALFAVDADTDGNEQLLLYDFDNKVTVLGGQGGSLGTAAVRLTPDGLQSWEFNTAGVITAGLLGTGAQVGLPTASAGSAGAICLATHRHAFSGRFMLPSASLAVALGAGFPINIDIVQINNAWTLRRLWVKVQTGPVGGTETYALVNAAGVVQGTGVTLAAGGLEVVGALQNTNLTGGTKYYLAQTAVGAGWAAGSTGVEFGGEYTMNI